MNQSVSVVIPIYNGASLLAKTLAGLAHQTYPRRLLQVVVADDGSTDNPAAVLAECGALDAVLVRQERDGFRLASARNLAIGHAEGDVIISLDGDMIPAPELVAEHVASLTVGSLRVSIGPRAYVDAGAITAEMILADPDAIERAPKIASASNWFFAKDRRERELAHLERHPAPYNCMHGCNCAYWRSHALKAGLYDETFNGHWGYEDTEFAYRLWRGGGRFIFTSSARAWHQENDVVDFNTRVLGDEVNFQHACRKIPGFRDFKKRLREQGRQPWW